MKRFELSWKDFQREENKKGIVVEVVVIILFSYFLLSLVSFWQYANGDVPYMSFWHAPWQWIINVIF